MKHGRRSRGDVGGRGGHRAQAMDECKEYKECWKKCRNRRSKASKTRKCSSSPPTMVGSKLRKLVDLIQMCPFFFTLSIIESSCFCGPVI